MKNPVLRILLVEDTPERQKALIHLYKDHAWILANTARRARDLLSAYEFDIVSLDYDLAGPGKGDEVARHLGNSRSAAALVIIHSMNTPGAKKIMKEIPSAVHVPFSKITRDNKTFKKLKAQLKNGTKIDWAVVFAKEAAS